MAENKLAMLIGLSDRNRSFASVWIRLVARNYKVSHEFHKFQIMLGVKACYQLRCQAEFGGIVKDKEGFVKIESGEYAEFLASFLDSGRSLCYTFIGQTNLLARG